MRDKMCRPLHVVLMTAVLLVGGCVNSADVVAPSAAVPDPEQLKAGETLFFQCIACHTTGRNEPHMQGPNLQDIFGSPAGQKAGFPYSEALASSDVVWNENTMDEWIQKPSEFIPGNMMAYIGMPNADDRTALIAYLKSVTSGE